jgi:4-aminobutyrate aminotransferase-like enzyme
VSFGDLLPAIVTPPPGPRSRELSAALAGLEAPGVNTIAGGQPAILWEEARGGNVRDVDGNLYIDLTAWFGVAASAVFSAISTASAPEIAK